MSYDYSQYSGDQIRYLIDKHIQLVKPGVFLTHTKWDEKANSHTTQLSTFSHNVIADTRLIQHYGFASTPLAGATSITLGIMGSNTNNAIVGTHDDRYTPRDLKPGEVSVHDYQGQSIELKQDQTINVNGQGNINISTPNSINFTTGGNKTASLRGGSFYVENIIPKNGWSGTFSTPTGQTVRVDAGIITDVS